MVDLNWLGTAELGFDVGVVVGVSEEVLPGNSLVIWPAGPAVLGDIEASLRDSVLLPCRWDDDRLKRSVLSSSPFPFALLRKLEIKPDLGCLLVAFPDGSESCRAGSLEAGSWICCPPLAD